MAASKVIQKGDGRLEIEAVLTRFSDGYVRVGIINGAQPSADGRLTMGELGAIHEFGAPAANIPARSFIWLGSQLKRAELKQMMPRLLRDVTKNKITLQAALRKLAETMQLGMRETFDLWRAHWAPLAASTIQKKGHDHPLLDTLTLRNAIDYDVKMGGKVRGSR